jgi:hypothetical protein
MLKLRTNEIGVQQGDQEVFSDFATGGEMWTGEGERERRLTVTFDEAYAQPPAVHVSMALVDLHSGPNFRTEVVPENIEKDRFDLVFRTWMDTRVARVRLSWLAIGPLANEDDWDV